MKKIFLVTSILMLALCFSSVSFAVRNINQYVTNVVFKIDEPLYGRTLDFTAEAEGGVVVKDVIWQEKEAINDASETTTVTAGTWQLRIIFGLATGKTGISTNNIISINDKTGLGWKKDDNGDYYVDTSYVVSAARPSNSSTGSRPTTSNSIPTRPATSTTTDSKVLKEVEITLKEPEFGKGFDKAPVFASEGIVYDHISWEGYELTGIPGNWVGCNNDDDAAIETKYRATIFFKLKEGYSIEGLESKVTTKKVGVVNGTKELEVFRDSIDVYNVKTQAFEVKQPEDAQKLESVIITVAEPKVGEALPKTCTLKTNFDKEAKEYAIPTEEKDVNISWALYYHKVVEAGTKYDIIARIDATGLAIPEDMKATVNGKEAKFEKSGNDVVITFSFEMPKEEVKPEETKPSGEEKEVEIPVLKTIDVTVKEPEVGKALPTTYEVKSNLVDKATEYKVGEEKEDNLAKWTPEDKEVKPGTKYTFKLEIALKNSMAEISKELKITVNKKEVKPTVKDGIYTVKYDFETEKPIEEKLYNHFEFEIAAPKIGEKPATTAKALSEKYKVTKVEWLTKDEKFVEGETYKVQIRFELIDKNVRSDYFATINGEMADLPNGDENYQKNTMYAEFTFPTLRDESKKVSWSNASAWALDELSKASNKGLIPQVLDKGDLKQNVTRKEFAHIAVSLYEKLSGQGIFVTHAPFKDTDDVEIAKAYTVGITNGVSETEFAPDTEITREQMATMMARALEKARVDTFVDLEKITKFVDDDKMHDWSRSAIYFMSSVEIIKGMGENRFGVKENASREQSIIIAVRSVEKFAK